MLHFFIVATCYAIDQSSARRLLLPLPAHRGRNLHPLLAACLPLAGRPPFYFSRAGGRILQLRLLRRVPGVH